MLRRPSPALVVAILALLVAMSGVGWAAIPASDGDVHACYSKKTFEIELVDTQKDAFQCERNWRGFTIDTKPTSLESPDGRYRIEVTNDGARMVGPNGSIVLGDDALTVDARKNMALTVGRNLSVTTGEGITVRGKKIDVTSDTTTNLKTTDLTVNASGKIDMKASGDASLKGSKVTQNR